MSQQLHYVLDAYDLAQLTDELLAAIPGLAPVLDPSLPVPGASRAVLGVEGSGPHITLTVPDDADVTAINGVVGQHNPLPIGSLDFASREAEETRTRLARLARAGQVDPATAELLRLIGA